MEANEAISSVEEIEPTSAHDELMVLTELDWRSRVMSCLGLFMMITVKRMRMIEGFTRKVSFSVSRLFNELLVCRSLYFFRWVPLRDKLCLFGIPVKR